MKGSEGRFRLRAVSDPRPRVDVGPPFRRLNGGWLALDFVNTVAGWTTNPVRRGGRDWGDRVIEERLGSYGDLVHWAEIQGWPTGNARAALLRRAKDQPAEAEAVARRARSLRAALFRLFRARVEDWTPLEEDVELLNAELDRLRRNEVVVPVGDSYELEWGSERAEPEALLWPPLRSAVALLTTPGTLRLLRQCGGPRCGWFFLGSGRGRPRRWCDIRDCGNVAKVRAFRRRQHP